MTRKYAIVNNTDAAQRTVFYDIDGRETPLDLAPGGIVWLER